MTACLRCAPFGVCVCVCRPVAELLTAPAPWPDDDPEAETYVPQSAREAS